MDPYLELRWERVHQSLTVYARDAIQPQLPDDLWALVQERVYVASEGEIDLVRAGRRVLALPENEIPPAHRGDCLACISPGWKRNRRELYPMPLRQRLRLPMLPIPLRPQESPVPLDLQALLDQAYTTGRYDHLDYRQPLDPPLPEADATWAEALLRAAGRR